MSARHFAGMTGLLFLMLCLVPSIGAQEEPLQEITVNPGDTMWSIANKYLKDPQKWPEIVKYNTLPTPDPTIALPGTKIKIPVLLIKEEYRDAHRALPVPSTPPQDRHAVDDGQDQERQHEGLVRRAIPEEDRVRGHQTDGESGYRREQRPRGQERQERERRQHREDVHELRPREDDGKPSPR